MGSEHLGAMKFRTERVGILAIAVNKALKIKQTAAVTWSHPVSEVESIIFLPSSPALVRDYIFNFIP